MVTEAASQETSAAFQVSRSFSARRWVWRGSNEEQARALALSAGISSSLAQLLTARGVTPDSIASFLNPTMKQWLPEPLLLKDMERAIARVRKALENQERIAVFGDYDVDGSASSAMLRDFFTAIDAPPRVYIPDRMTEGYGPSAQAFETLKGEGASLVITVDCGAAAIEALSAARSNGLDVVILDHHAVEAEAPAFAHVNPNQPGDLSGQTQLCATGVAFVFLAGLNRSLRDGGYYTRKGLAEPDLRLALDLVALATICDVVPLVGVNRAFVRSGLARMSANCRPGLAALAAIARVKPPFTADNFGYAFGPRINAGGRVGKCDLGSQLLSTTDLAQAQEIATLLDLHNRERQAIEKEILVQAIASASSQENAPFLLLASEGWHSGVVGVVAGRLKDRFGKPAFVVGFEGGHGRGSARSIPGVDIGAVVRLAREKGLVDAGGGHAMAAGFSLSSAQIERFSAFLAERFAQIDGEIATAQTLEIECAVSPAAARASLVDEMAMAGPFGAGNPEPIIAVPNAQLVHADIVGQDHVRVRLRGGDGARLDGIAFRTAGQPLGKALLMGRGRQIHLAGKLRADEWQGVRRAQIHIEDAAPAEA